MTESERSEPWSTRWVRLGAILCLVGSVAMAAESVRRMLKRLQFDYDLVLWADEYFMTSLFKLDAGVPVYTSVADANSTIYSPGGVYLHHALLAPLGLDTSLGANKMLVQGWLAIGIVIAAAAVVAMAHRMGALPPPGPNRGVAYGVTAGALACCVYTNPTADSLHPTAIELCVLAVSMLQLARWDDLGRGTRIATLALLPAFGLLAKQSCGVALVVALTLVSVTHWKRTARRDRAVHLVLPVASFCSTLAALTWWTDGWFHFWSYEVLSRHELVFWKVSDLYSGYGLLFYPVLAVALWAARLAWRERNRPWLRASTVAMAYFPLALLALFKRLGGPNNLAVIGFTVAVLAMPYLLRAIFERQQRWVGPIALLVLGGQLALWYPRRRVPTDFDRQAAETICSYSAARMRCGERVLLARGSVCYRRGGVEVPTERAMSLIELTAAGFERQLGFYDRVARREYDLMIFPIQDLQFFGRPLWNLMQSRYKAFYTTTKRDHTDGDFWFHGWQGFSSQPIVFFERTSESGRHAVSEAGMHCDAHPSAGDTHR